MPVKLSGQHVFAASRETVWGALTNAEVLSRTLPGAESLQQTAENQFEGVIQLKVGPVQGQFTGQVVLSDLEPPAGYKLKMQGNGAPGFVEGNGAIRLTALEPARTQLDYDVEAQVGGRIAGVGQRLLDSSAKVITRQALEQLERQVAALAAQAPEAATAATGGEAAPVVDPAALAAPPSQAEMAKEFASGLAAELVPKKVRLPLLLAVAVVLVLIAAVVLRGC